MPALRSMLTFSLAFVGLLCLLLLGFGVYSTYKPTDTVSMPHTMHRKATEFPQPSGTGRQTCKNTLQGATHISDDRGYTCFRELWNQTSGCCPTEDENREDLPRFSCETCHEKYKCCTSFELCVSCCQGKYKDLETAFQAGAMDLDIFRVIEVHDVFDMCLARCRTSSKSVVHQNTFRSKLKHCYGAKEPPLTLDESEPNNAVRKT